MILKALCDYYNRKKDSSILPLYGMEYKEIGFLIVIDGNGRFLRFEDRRIDNNHAQSFLVKKSVGRSSAPVPNFLYDNSKYVFCYSTDGDKEKNRKYFDVFKQMVENVYESAPNDPFIIALNLFYQKDIDDIVDVMRMDPLWDDINKNLNKKFSNFSFLLNGETEIIAARSSLIGLQDDSSQKENSGRCLVTGEHGILSETTTATSIQGSQATAKLVSFQVKSGYDSYGREKGYNAQISKKSEFEYTTALNYLLRSDSRNKFILGNRTFVFWASTDNEASTQTEEGLFALLHPQKDCDPDKGISKVKDAFNSIYSGKITSSSNDTFHILGLAPNAARIAVVYWAEIQIKEFVGIILRHFEDMDIIGYNTENYKGLHSILGAVTLGGKSSDATPNLGDSVVRSIFEGRPYPYTLFANCIRRIKAESSDKVNSITQGRAAILKAYICRHNNKKTIKAMLDKTNNNLGYLCGRLFSVLDKIQEDVNGQHSIKERYLNAASATPSSVFPTILNLSAHHSEKLNEGSIIFYEKIKQEIIGKLPSSGFPNNLSLQDQGCFFIGYYHQRQDFFSTKDKEKNNDNDNDQNK